MKEIVAIFKPFKLDEVKNALFDSGVEGMTVTEVKGFGRTGGKNEGYRGAAQVVDFVPKVQVSMVLPDSLVRDAVARLVAAARTEKIGAGKVFVSPALQATRIRTGEEGDTAVHSTALSPASTSGINELVQVTAVIKPFKLDDVKDRLSEVGVQGLTVIETKGFGRTGGKKELYRGSAYVVDFVSKVKLFLVVPATRMVEVVNAVLTGARTGRIGDGKVFVSTVETAIRIRTGEEGLAAVWDANK